MKQWGSEHDQFSLFSDVRLVLVSVFIVSSSFLLPLCLFLGTNIRSSDKSSMQQLRIKSILPCAQFNFALMRYLYMNFIFAIPDSDPYLDAVISTSR